jgi:hypothetical protein
LVVCEFEPGSQLTTLGEEAFGYCKSLQAFRVPAGVTSVGDFCFGECKSLQSLVFEAPCRLRKLALQPHMEWPMQAIEIPDSVEELIVELGGSAGGRFSINCGRESALRELTYKCDAGRSFLRVSERTLKALRDMHEVEQPPVKRPMDDELEWLLECLR